MDIFCDKLIIFPSLLDLHVDFDYGEDGGEEAEEFDAVACEGIKEREADAAS